MFTKFCKYVVVLKFRSLQNSQRMFYFLTKHSFSTSLMCFLNYKIYYFFLIIIIFLHQGFCLQHLYECNKMISSCIFVCMIYHVLLNLKAVVFPTVQLRWTKSNTSWNKCDQHFCHSLPLGKKCMS